MIISEKSTKVVFVSLVCLSLGALLGLDVKSQSQSVDEINTAISDKQGQTEMFRETEGNPER